jgi:hypothetical protein
MRISHEGREAWRLCYLYYSAFGYPFKTYFGPMLIFSKKNLFYNDKYMHIATNVNSTYFFAFSLALESSCRLISARSRGIASSN